MFLKSQERSNQVFWNGLKVSKFSLNILYKLSNSLDRNRRCENKRIREFEGNQGTEGKYSKYIRNN